MYIRLNVFDHVLALFGAKFACISTIRYPVFRWELCKGCMWEECEEFKCVSIQRILVTRSRKWLATGDSPKCHTCEACRKLKGHDSWSTTGQKCTIWPGSYLVTHPTREWVARMPCFEKKWLFTFLTYFIINTFIPTKCRELLERILRE